LGSAAPSSRRPKNQRQARSHAVATMVVYIHGSK
jgi:hypothetical protein